MQTAKYDFAGKAATFKALALKTNMDYDEAKRAHWLTLNALHGAYDNLAGAANKLENADQQSPELYGIIRRVVTELCAIEGLIAKIDIERVASDPVYAGSNLALAKLARSNAENVNQLSIATNSAMKALDACTRGITSRTEFAAQPKKKVAVVKGSFTHTRGGGPVRFYTGEHCAIDTILPEGDMRIAGDNGGTSVYFKKDEVERLFDIVEV